jgi:hypothetical protein
VIYSGSSGRGEVNAARWAGQSRKLPGSLGWMRERGESGKEAPRFQKSGTSLLLEELLPCGAG